MKPLLLVLTAQLLFLAASAQQISGTVRDESGNPIKGATATLLKVRDTSAVPVKFAVTSETGNYVFANVTPGTYSVSTSYIGFKPNRSGIITVTGTPVSLPDQTLARLPAQLQAVTVTARKPLIEVKADRMIVNVEETINAVGLDALELLRRSPGVSVDKDDNVSMNGKTGVQVYVDGRPSPLTGTDLSNYLKSLQSSQIESIELITNPSARYEAAGNAGIINIRLKKNKSLGTNGSVNGVWSIGNSAKYNGGFSVNYRDRHVNLFGTYGYNDAPTELSLNLKRTVADSLFNQQTSILFNTHNHNLKAGMDYYIDKKSILGFVVNGNFTGQDGHTNSTTPIIYLPTNVINRTLVAQNNTVATRNNINTNLNYTYTGTDGKSLAVNADYGTYTINTNQFQPNNYYDSTLKNLLGSVTYQIISPATISITSLKADWDQNALKGRLSLGGKISFVTTDNDFQRYNVFGSQKTIDNDHSNHFKYTENINAAYLNYQRVWKGVVIQAGLRMENTAIEGTSTGLKNTGGTYVGYDSTFRRNYVDFFPSAAITFNKDPMKQWSFTYSRRIDRPAYQDLNPFENKIDEYTMQKGNINLLPQYTNSFGVSYIYKNKLVTTLNYSAVRDLFTQIIDTTEVSKAILSKKNLASQDILSLNISYPFSYRTYSLFTNVSSNYSQYRADLGPGRMISLNAFGLNAVAQNSLRFAKVWTAELTAFYNAPTVYAGSFNGQSIWSISTGIQKTIFHGNGSLKASLGDIFNSLRFRGSQDFAGQKTEVNQKAETRIFRLAFTYRFGSNTVKAARQRNSGSEDENKRVQSGGGLGIGN